MSGGESQSFASRIMREGRVVEQNINAPDIIPDQAIAKLKECILENISNEFGDAVDVTHDEKILNGIKIYISPQNQIYQVADFLRTNHSISAAIVSKQMQNCIVVRFRISPSLQLKNFLINILYGFIAIFVIWVVLAEINPKYSISNISFFSTEFFENSSSLIQRDSHSNCIGPRCFF